MNAHEYSEYIIYADESGDTSLSTINEHHPVFVLAFCIFSKKEYRSEVVKHVKEFKFNYWGHDMVVLHSSKLRKQTDAFDFLVNPKKRALFIGDMNTVFRNSPFTIISTAIDKRLLKERYSIPFDPYELALTFCLEKLYLFLQEKGEEKKLTHLVIESRGLKEDKDLELAFRRILDKASASGNDYLFEIVFADKKSNSIGLQIADLVSYPIARYVVTQKNESYEILKEKFHEYPNYYGKGLKIFPVSAKHFAIPGLEKRKAPEYSEATAPTRKPPVHLQSD